MLRVLARYDAKITPHCTFPSIERWSINRINGPVERKQAKLALRWLRVRGSDPKPDYLGVSLSLILASYLASILYDITDLFQESAVIICL